MLRTFTLAAALLLAVGCSQPAQAPARANTNSVAASSVQVSPESVVDAFAAALQAGDAEAVSRLMAPDVIIAEGGEAEQSFAEYAAHHLPADIAFAAAVTSTRRERKIVAGEDMATIISHSEMRGSFHGRAIHANAMETMVLRRTDGAWRIVHVHWSSSPITGER